MRRKETEIVAVIGEELFSIKPPQWIYFKNINMALEFLDTNIMGGICIYHCYIDEEDWDIHVDKERDPIFHFVDPENEIYVMPDYAARS